MKKSFAAELQEEREAARTPDISYHKRTEEDIDEKDCRSQSQGELGTNKDVDEGRHPGCEGRRSQELATRNGHRASADDRLRLSCCRQPRHAHLTIAYAPATSVSPFLVSHDSRREVFPWITPSTAGVAHQRSVWHPVCVRLEPSSRRCLLFVVLLQLRYPLL